MKKFAIILSGSGVYDGSEIHEATLTLYAIAKKGAMYEVFAPDIAQHHVVNHITGDEMPEKRNVLVESARIARGKIKNLKAYNPEDFDGLILPGGFGAAKNLSTFAFDGANLTVNEEVKTAVIETQKTGNPIGALCIAPVIFAKLFEGAEVTVGQDAGTAEVIEKMGGKHCATSHGEITVDKKRKLVTTPCYMLDGNIAQVGKGVGKLVKAMLKMM